MLRTHPTWIGLPTAALLAPTIHLALISFNRATDTTLDTAITRRKTASRTPTSCASTTTSRWTWTPSARLRAANSRLMHARALRLSTTRRSRRLDPRGRPNSWRSAKLLGRWRRRSRPCR